MMTEEEHHIISSHELKTNGAQNKERRDRYRKEWMMLAYSLLLSLVPGVVILTAIWGALGYPGWIHIALCCINGLIWRLFMKRYCTYLDIKRVTRRSDAIVDSLIATV